MSESGELVIRLSDNVPESLRDFDAPVAVAKIDNADDLAEASRRRLAWAEITRLADAEFDPQIDRLKEALAKERKRKKDFLAPFVEYDNVTKAAMEDYHRAEFAKQQAQRDRLERAVREVVEKNALAEASRLAAEGKTDEANERLADMSAPLPLPPINTKSAPKVEGSQVRFTRKWSVVDIEQVNAGFFEMVKMPLNEKIGVVVKSASPRDAEKIVGGIEVRHEPIVARSSRRSSDR